MRSSNLKTRSWQFQFIFIFWCINILISPITWAASFPNAGLDNVESLAQFRVTLTRNAAIFLRDQFGLPFCQNNNGNCPTAARIY